VELAMEVTAVVAAVEMAVAEIFLVLGVAGLGLVRFLAGSVGVVVGAYVHVPPGHDFLRTLLEAIVVDLAELHSMPEVWGRKANCKNPEHWGLQVLVA
jgi:hypothetical protein